MCVLRLEIAALERHSIKRHSSGNGTGAKRLELMTLGENKAARAFYDKMGMQEQSIILTQALT